MADKTHITTDRGRQITIASSIVGIAFLFGTGSGWVQKDLSAQIPSTFSVRKIVERTNRASVTENKTVGPVRILPLGDSITQSDRDHRSYRYNLWKKMVDADIDFDYVGSMNSNFQGNPPWPDYRGKSFDPDHEGHWGWRADQILNGTGNPNHGRLADWLDEYTPDIVLLHIGSNDIFQAQSASSTGSQIRQIIRTLRADNPDVVILLAKLIPARRVGPRFPINSLNSLMDEIARETTTVVSPVIVVDQNSDFHFLLHSYDWVHPNELGEEKMAEKWFQALMTVIEN